MTLKTLTLLIIPLLNQKSLFLAVLESFCLNISWIPDNLLLVFPTYEQEECQYTAVWLESTYIYENIAIIETYQVATSSYLVVRAKPEPGYVTHLCRETVKMTLPPGDDCGLWPSLSRSKLVVNNAGKING